MALGARSRAVAHLALGLAAMALVGGDVLGLSSGISEELDRGAPGGSLAQGGCSCHNPAYTGNVVAVLEGVPSFYAFGGQRAQGPFVLNVSLRGGPPEGGPAGTSGGFHLAVTGGTLSAPAGAGDVQAFHAGEAGHTFAGNRQRAWQVLWTPPDPPGPDVVFILTVNAVDGDAMNDPGDEWGRTTMVSLGTERLAPPAPPAAPRPLGVPGETAALAVLGLALAAGTRRPRA